MSLSFFVLLRVASWAILSLKNYSFLPNRFVTLSNVNPTNCKSASLLRATILLLLLGWLVTSVYAHPVPFSYLDLRLSQGQIESTLVAHVIDLAHDLNMAAPEALLDTSLAESKKEAILNLLRQRLLLAADGRALGLELLRVEPLPDRQALAMHLRLSPNVSAGVLRIQCAMFPYDPQHQTFLNIYDQGTLVHQQIFSKDHVSFEYFSGNQQGTLAVVKKFILGGIYHIFT
ncbi:MAG: hypothetical protein M3X11_19695, partial [Acidobacteriota bacterium]|nr:hypothetical protein [Acidobacteriota bacterium]